MHLSEIIFVHTHPKLISIFISKTQSITLLILIVFIDLLKKFHFFQGIRISLNLEINSKFLAVRALFNFHLAHLLTLSFTVKGSNYFLLTLQFAFMDHFLLMLTSFIQQSYY